MLEFYFLMCWWIYKVISAEFHGKSASKVLDVFPLDADISVTSYLTLHSLQNQGEFTLMLPCPIEFMQNSYCRCELK